jgi:hypothetical protein
MSEMARSWKRALPVVIGVLVAVVLLVRVGTSIDLSRLPQILSALGPVAIILLVPYLLAILVDTAGWLKLIPRASGVLFRTLFWVRVQTESLLLTMPLGSIAADSLKPYLLRAESGLAYPSSVASLILRKCMLGLSEAVFMAVVALLSWTVLAKNSIALMGTVGLQYIDMGASLALFLMFGCMTAIVLYSGVAQRVHRFLVWLPILKFFQSARQSVFAAEEKFEQLGEALKSFGRSRSDLWISGIAYAFMWICESIETWLILRMLGANVGLLDAMAIETVVSLLRSIAFFVPSGLGVQDIGYLAFFKAFGIVCIAAPGLSGLLGTPANNVGSFGLHGLLTLAEFGGAFLLIKRTRELLWAGSGYLMLFWRGLNGQMNKAKLELRSKGLGNPGSQFSEMFEGNA